MWIRWEENNIKQTDNNNEQVKHESFKKNTEIDNRYKCEM